MTPRERAAKLREPCYHSDPLVNVCPDCLQSAIAAAEREAEARTWEAAAESLHRCGVVAVEVSKTAAYFFERAKNLREKKE